MGFAASSARLYMLVARKSDLEFQMQMLSQSRMRLANVMDKLYMRNMRSVNLDPENPEVRAIETELAMIQQRDKYLEILMNRIQSQHQAVETELESVRKVISKNIQSSFGLFAKA